MEDIIHNVNVNDSGHRNVNSGVQRQEYRVLEFKYSSVGL
jgi:hypothetical protein